MGRGKLASTVPLKQAAFEAVNNLAEHGILAVRRKKNGEIKQVKTAVFGWLSAEAYGMLQGAKGLEPIIAEIIKGGYMLKAAVWTVSIPIDVLASGTSVPLGPLLVISAIALAYGDQAAGNTAYAALDLMALALPFGELYLAWRLSSVLIQGVNTAASWIDQIAAQFSIPAVIQSSQLLTQAAQGKLNQYATDPYTGSQVV